MCQLRKETQGRESLLALWLRLGIFTLSELFIATCVPLTFCSIRIGIFGLVISGAVFRQLSSPFQLQMIHMAISFGDQGIRIILHPNATTISTARRATFSDLDSFWLNS
jgi:hypothetical protein